MHDVHNVQASAICWSCILFSCPGVRSCCILVELLRLTAYKLASAKAQLQTFDLPRPPTIPETGAAKPQADFPKQRSSNNFHSTLQVELLVIRALSRSITRIASCNIRKGKKAKSVKSHLEQKDSSIVGPNVEEGVATCGRLDRYLTNVIPLAGRRKCRKNDLLHMNTRCKLFDHASMRILGASSFLLNYPTLA
jgi:hypothetical protein